MKTRFLPELQIIESRYRRLSHSKQMPGFKNCSPSFRIVHRKSDDPDVWKLGMNDSRRFQTIHIWHIDVHQDNFQLQLP